MPIDTERLSARYRDAAINAATHEVLLTDFRGTQQEPDLTEPANCDGLGRIRHFRRDQANGWMPNSLPIDPATRALGIERTSLLRAQVFQNAVCNWRCWYCYVPFDLLSANAKHSRWVTAEQLVAAYQDQEEPPKVIDLTGGQPDLTPEWVPWVMRALRKAGLADKTYLWSDDNLSNDYFWTYLSRSDIDLITGYRNYGRVACFKGFDEESFAFNTAAEPELFERQFVLFERFATLGIDIFAYTTFTAPMTHDLSNKMSLFVDRLQRVRHNLPLRTVPLHVQEFAPVGPRLDDAKRNALRNQYDVFAAWSEQLERRFTPAERAMNIATVPL
jgi:organic radical activating enzyme